MTRKEKRFETYGSRWGPGKVHRYLYDDLNGFWYVACMQNRKTGNPHGDEVSLRHAITCKRCGLDDTPEP